MPTNEATGEGLYPVDQWLEEFQTLHVPPDSRERHLYDPADLTLRTQPGLVAEECVELMSFQGDRQSHPDRVGAINRQAQGENRIAQPVFDVLGIDYALNPVVAELVRMITHSARYTLFDFKVRHGRARPHHRCAGLKPLFMDDKHPLHPGHGSFPSGHATIAAFWAALLGHYRPQQLTTMLNVAEEVGRKRERAGLHFKSDTDAGLELGAVIARRMIDAKNANQPKALEQPEVDSILNARRPSL